VQPIYKKIILFTLILSIAGGLGANLVNSTATKVIPGEWEDVHQWREQGKCLDCHTSTENFSKTNLNLDHSINLPTKYHTDKFRKFTHGRTISVNPQSCLSCHRKNTCNTCHAQMPDTHTSRFTNPTGSGDGIKYHVVIGKIRPSSCLICHKSFKNDCTSCHTLNEILPWQKKALIQLKNWKGFIDRENIEENR